MENVKFADVGLHRASPPNIPPTINNNLLPSAGEYGGRKPACFSNKTSNH
jgi:hypothetical protein